MFLILFIQYAFSQLLYPYQYNEDVTQLKQFQSFKDEQECFKFIVEQKDQKIIMNREILYFTFQKQWINCSIDVINYFNNMNIDVYQIFQKIKLEQKNINKNLFDKLVRLLPQSSAFLNVLEPCYLWGQNMTHLLLKIKFTTKIDVPSLSQINRLTINITASDIYIEGYQFENLNRYILRIQTYKLMNPNIYHYEIVELGQIFLEILKSPSPYFWKNIHSNIRYNPINQYIWWDMYYRYREQLETAFGLLEDAENQREEDERKELNTELKLRQSKKQFAKINEDNQELNKQLYCRNCNPLNGDEWSSWML